MNIISIFASQIIYLNKLVREDTYRVELKNLKEDESHYEFRLDDQFFKNLEESEIQRGNVKVLLTVKKSFSDVFLLNFQLDGDVSVLCDRCLDEMSLSVSCENDLKVKFGEEYGEDDNFIFIPEQDGYIDVSWNMYEFIILSLPMTHVHAHGECNIEMLGKLEDHLTYSVEDNDVDDDSLISDDSETDTTFRINDPRLNELKKILDNN